MTTLQITIEGPPDSGKTTTARLIENALREAGYKDVKVSDKELAMAKSESPSGLRDQEGSSAHTFHSTGNYDIPFPCFDNLRS